MNDEPVSRRQVLGKLSVGLAATAGMVNAPAFAQRPAGALTLLHALEVSFSDPGILELLANPASTRYVPPASFPPPGFVREGRVAVEELTQAFDEQDAAVKLRVVGQQRRRYALYENDQQVNVFWMDLLLYREVKLELVLWWAYAQNLDAAARSGWTALIQEFMQAVRAAGANAPEIEEFMLDRAAARNLNPAQVVFALRMEVVAVGAVVEDERLRTYVRFLAGSGAGSAAMVRGGQVVVTNFDAALGPRKFRLEELDREGVTFPLPRVPAVNEVDAPEEVSDREVANTLTQKMTRGMNCRFETTSGKEHEIGTLLQWPDPKVEWEMCSVRIRIRISRWLRISITVKMKLPVLYIRTMKRKAFSFIRWSVEAPLQDIQDAAVECALEAALVGAVFGVILSNPAAALAAFKGAFQQCMKQKGREFVKCLLAAVVLRNVPTPYRRL